MYSFGAHPCGKTAREQGLAEDPDEQVLPLRGVGNGFDAQLAPGDKRDLVLLQERVHHFAVIDNRIPGNIHIVRQLLHGDIVTVPEQLGGDIIFPLRQRHFVVVQVHGLQALVQRLEVRALLEAQNMAVCKNRRSIRKINDFLYIAPQVFSVI